MGRIVAIGGGDLQSNLPINRYIVGMDKKERHNLLFVGTASKDAEGYIDSIKTTFEQLDCCVKALCLATKEYTQKEWMNWWSGRILFMLVAAIPFI